MILGKRIKELRLNKGIKQKELAQMLGVSENTMYRWEAGLNSPSDKDKGRLAKLLNVSIAYLIGEDFCSERIKAPILRTASPSRMIEIPLITPVVFCCPDFDNNGINEAEEAVGFIALPADMVGSVGRRRPFATRVEGESMDAADIPSGCEIAVNPEAEIYNGDPVLICFGARKEWAVKWIYWNKDGSADFRSPNVQYPSLAFTKIDFEKGWCRILGKVMKVILSPKKGI